MGPEMFFDWASVEHHVDTLTPEFRAMLPFTAKEAAALSVACSIQGIADLLRRDDVPWSDLAVNRDARHTIGDQLADVAAVLMERST